MIFAFVKCMIGWYIETYFVDYDETQHAWRDADADENFYHDYEFVYL